MNTDELKALIPLLAQRRVIVMGDLILDEYLIGRASRLSREAPVPVLEFESRELIPGGAANPAANIAALGSAPVQIGVVGADAHAVTLREVLHTRGIETGALVTDVGRPTTVKTRIMAQMGLRFPQQVARMDTLSRVPISHTIEQQVIAHLNTHITSASAVLLSDYHTGLLTQTVVAAACRLAHENQVLLAADAQGELDKYRGFTLVKCNADEARDYLRHDLHDDAEYGRAAAELREKLGLTGAMVITRGPDGATVAESSGAVTHVRAPAVTDVYDTVGAGDTAVAVMTLAAAAGASWPDAALLANYASGLVVRRVGNYTPTPAELAAAITAS